MLAWLTFIAAAIAAIASGVTALRQWRSWSIDRWAKRFDDSLARALSQDPRTALIGEAQVTGMVERHEMARADRGYVRDTFTTLAGPAAPPGDLEIVATTAPGDNEDEQTGGHA